MQRKLTRIERHRAKVAWSATVPFLMAYIGVLLYVFAPGIAHWVTYTMIAAGLTVGAVCIGLSHPRIALGPVLYQWKGDPTFLCVIVNPGEVWDKMLDRAIEWQRVMQLVPGIYLLQGEPFMAFRSLLMRHTDVFHPTATSYDDEKDLER